MSNTVNNGIPFVPENTIDPAAGLNESLLTVDALLQLAVVSVGGNTPPGSPANGARYIVGTAPTGAWAGRANQVAQWLDGSWRFFTTARYALNAADGMWYVRQSTAWITYAGPATAWGSITGTLSAQTDLQGALDGKVGTGDSRLTDAREWSAETVSQAEAEAGTATTRRAWTAERVRKAILGWWNGATSVFGRGFVAAADAAAGRTALGLGTAAVANVTTSQTDTTAGRVLRVGDFGRSSASLTYVAGTLDSLNYTSTWNASTALASSDNFPFPVGGVLTVERGPSANYATQEYSILVGSMSRKAIRHNNNGVWQPWRELFHTGNLIPNVLATYTLATLPSAAANPRLQVYCSNLTGQPAPVFSDGTNWRRVSDNTVAN